MSTNNTSGLGFQPIGNQIVSRKGLERLADVDPRLTRSHYFDNRLLTDKDLNRDQLYIDGRLREVGQSLGYGVLRGLEAQLDQLNGEISVTPGIAISEAGRVLELSKTLVLDLGDKATILKLNNGRHKRLKRGLYAIVIQYSEHATDVAEVFPTDLGDKRGANYDLITEGVQLSMVSLRLPFAQHYSLQIRANLMTKLYGVGFLAGIIPEDAVALGVIAISDDRPQWLDQNLLRQPLRAYPKPGDQQQDLFRQYQKLFSDLMEYRTAGALTGDFAASDYFRLLPPVGALPKESIDPVSGRQGFFPEEYQVWIAPIRKAELDLIVKESMVLPPLDLTLAEQQDIIVLAPLSNSDYAHYAQRLERPLNSESRRLPHIDLLRLRLYPKRPVHELNTDEASWQAIWDTVTEDDLIYIRRPLRAAETRVSGIVLAQGISLPETPPAESPDTPADSGLLQDEDSVFLNRMNIPLLISMRGTDSTESSDAASLLESEFSGQALVVQQLLNLCLRIERDYDEVLWQTLLEVARSEQLVDFYQQLVSAQEEDTLTGVAVNNIGASFGLAAELLSQWNSLAESS